MDVGFDGVCGIWVRILADNKYFDRVQRIGEGAEHILAGRQVAAAGGNFVAQEIAESADCGFDGCEFASP